MADDTKARMVAKLLTFGELEKNRVGLPAFPIVTGESKLWDFVTEESWDFFKILKVQVDWLTWPPVRWEESNSYRKIENVITTAKVINDTAERAIKLASDYAQSLTKDSKMRQKLFKKKNKTQRYNYFPCPFLLRELREDSFSKHLSRKSMSQFKHNKKMSRRTSHIWKYFVVAEDDPT